MKIFLSAALFLSTMMLSVEAGPCASACPASCATSCAAKCVHIDPSKANRLRRCLRKCDKTCMNKCTKKCKRTDAPTASPTVTSTDSPTASPSAPPTKSFVDYGHKIFLQSNAADNRWLTGGRGAGNAFVVTRDQLGSAYERNVRAAYEWTVRSVAGSGARADVDPIAGQCLKFGDTIHLQVNNLDKRWLSGSRSGGNVQVVTRDKFRDTYEQTTAAKTYEWIVRSVAGDGSKAYVDPSAGQCVNYGDKIHLQNDTIDNRWLTGSRGSGAAQVETRDKLGSTYEQTTAATTYEWIVLSDVGTGGRP